MKIKRAAAAWLAASLLAGCATGYHDAGNLLLGYTGGYWEAKGPGDLIKVGFSGNAFITRGSVSTYLAYRCAEVARREGHNWFAMYESLPAAIVDRRTTEKVVGTLGGKPTGYAYILLFDAQAPGLLSADDVIARLKPLVDNGGKAS